MAGFLAFSRSTVRSSSSSWSLCLFFSMLAAQTWTNSAVSSASWSPTDNFVVREGGQKYSGSWSEEPSSPVFTSAKVKSFKQYQNRDCKAITRCGSFFPSAGRQGMPQLLACNSRSQGPDSKWFNLFWCLLHS